MASAYSTVLIGRNRVKRAAQKSFDICDVKLVDF